MEQTPNQNYLSNDLTLDAVANAHLKETARWGKFLGITGMVVSVLFIIFGFFSPSLFAVIIFAPKVGLMLYFCRLFLEGIYIATISARMQRTENLGSYLWYQLYALIIPFFYMYSFLKREPNEWKGRVYA